MLNGRLLFFAAPAWPRATAPWRQPQRRAPRERLVHRRSRSLIASTPRNQLDERRSAGLRSSPAELLQKISGYLRAAEFAQDHCRISSDLQAMTHRRVNPLAAIHRALCAQRYAAVGK